MRLDRVWVRLRLEQARPRLLRLGLREDESRLDRTRLRHGSVVHILLWSLLMPGELPFMNRSGKLVSCTIHH